MKEVTMNATTELAALHSEVAFVPQGDVVIDSSLALHFVKLVGAFGDLARDPQRLPRLRMSACIFLNCDMT